MMMQGWMMLRRVAALCNRAEFKVCQDSSNKL